MKFKVRVELEVSPEMNEVLNQSAEKLDGLLLVPINMGLKGYFKHHLSIIAIAKEMENNGNTRPEESR